MSDRTTFRLPGHDSSLLAERKCLLSLLAAYSRKWNPRNLEHPWYQPWGQILAALVVDHPSFSIAPQPYLWYDEDAFNPRSTSGADPMEEPGNTSLDSIRTISVPSHRDRVRIPDFAIARVVSFPAADDEGQLLHLSRSVTYFGFPLLAELKASGRRSDDIETNLFHARRPMILARIQLYKQAVHLFRMYPHQQSVVLVAITGFWWSYCIFPRSMVEDVRSVNDEEKDDDDEQFEMEDPLFRDQYCGTHSLLEQELSNLDQRLAQALQKQLHACGSTLARLRNMPQEAQFHTVMPEGKVKLITNGRWSDCLLYGSAASNQVFSLILDRLHDVVQHFHRGEMG